VKLNCTLLFQFFNFFITYWLLRSLLLKNLLELFFSERNDKNRQKNQLKELELKEKKLIQNEADLYEEFQKKIKAKEALVDLSTESPIKIEPFIIENQAFSELELKEITQRLQAKIEKECYNAD
jgi:hypothetical protein